MNTIYISSFRYTHVITSIKFWLKQTWRLTKAIAETKSTLNKCWNWSSCTKLALSARWTHNLIARPVRPSDQLSMTNSNNPSVVNTICISSFLFAYVITSINFWFKQTWRLTKANPKWNVTPNKRWSWSSWTKLAQSASWTHGMIAQSVRASDIFIYLSIYIYLYLYIYLSNIYIYIYIE